MAKRGQLIRDCKLKAKPKSVREKRMSSRFDLAAARSRNKISSELALKLDQEAQTADQYILQVLNPSEPLQDGIDAYATLISEKEVYAMMIDVIGVEHNYEYIIYLIQEHTKLKDMLMQRDSSHLYFKEYYMLRKDAQFLITIAAPSLRNVFDEFISKSAKAASYTRANLLKIHADLQKRDNHVPFPTLVYVNEYNSLYEALDYVEDYMKVVESYMNDENTILPHLIIPANKGGLKGKKIYSDIYEEYKERLKRSCPEQFEKNKDKYKKVREEHKKKKLSAKLRFNNNNNI